LQNWQCPQCGYLFVGAEAPLFSGDRLGIGWNEKSAFLGQPGDNSVVKLSGNDQSLFRLLKGWFLGLSRIPKLPSLFSEGHRPVHNVPKS